MDKNAIKKYAVWARNELIARVTQKAEQYEITENKITSADADSIGGRVLSASHHGHQWEKPYSTSGGKVKRKTHSIII